MALTIRQAGADDATVLSRMMRDLHSLHAAALPTRFKPTGPETYPPSKVLDQLVRQEALFFIAEVDEQPAGYIYLEIREALEDALRLRTSMLYVEHIYVGAKYRGQGVGTALINAARATARERGIQQVGLDVWSFNSSARAYFHRQGFVTFREILCLEEPRG